MNISIKGVKCIVKAHKYAVEIIHPNIQDPFKIVVKESINKETGESLGWIAAPEIQLRQTKGEKQEYIMSNKNSTPEAAIEECLRKMAISPASEVFYKVDFEDNYNRLW
jgi:hypothetical protein